MRTPNSLMFLLHFVLFSVVTAQNSNKQMPIGVILDLDTLVGKMAQTSIAMALEDFYATYWNYSTRLVLHTRDSNKDNVKATLAALDLLQNNKTEVIIGPLQSSQAVIVSEFGNTSQVPVISFSATSPTLTSINLPYFIRTTINDAAQVKPITSLIKAYGWRQVVPIYEDTDFGRGILPFLVDALEEINVRIPYRSLISKWSTDDQIKQELYKLQTMQTRVFVVHMSFSLGSSLFLKAKELGMMREGYVWIMTDGVTNMIDSLKESVNSAMNGALGVRLYVPKTDELNDFITRWKMRFREDNPKEKSNEPSIYALWAYDTTYALAMAAEKVGVQNTKIDNSTAPQMLPVFPNGPLLLKMITNIKFRGLSGNFELINGQLQYSLFEIINIVGKGIRAVGYWREENGLSRDADESNKKRYYSTSPGDLNPVIWPGETIVVPKGWQIPVDGTKLRVGVALSVDSLYINVEIDPHTNATKARGYSVDVFEAAVKRLPYAVPFEYEHFRGTPGETSLVYNDLVYQVYLGKYDIIIGDITIRHNRTRYVDFSMPYTDSGVAMIVLYKQAENKNTFIFLQPLSSGLWLGSFAFLICTGITILILEPKIRAPLKRSISKHVGTIVQLSLFAYQEKLESILSKIVAIVSIFFLLILTSSYTASLSSMLTVKQLQPTVTDIYELKNNGDYIGYNKGSFVGGLLQQQGFDSTKLKGYNPEEYAEALDKGSAHGGVTAIIDETPYIKLFLGKKWKSYTMVGPIYKTAGFGFAFPKGSPLVADISKAILNITDGDDIIQIEKKWIGDTKTLSSASLTELNRLNFLCFSGLFLITGVISTICLLIFATMSFYKKRKKNITIMSLDMSSHESGIEAVPTMNQEEDQVGDAVGIAPVESDTDTSPTNANTIS